MIIIGKIVVLSDISISNSTNIQINTIYDNAIEVSMSEDFGIKGISIFSITFLTK